MRSEGHECLQNTLNDWADEIYALAKAKGWHEDDTETEDEYIERCCNNLHDEVSELHTAWRDNKLHADCDKASDMEQLLGFKLTCLEEELADIIIRVLDSSRQLGVDIAEAVRVKHEYNKTRAYRRGGKRS